MHYSTAERPDHDSGVQFACGLLPELRAKLDAHIYLVTPLAVASYLRTRLPCAGFTFLTVEQPAYQRGGGFYMNPVELDRLIEHRSYDFDLALINTPESTCAYADYFNKRKFYEIPVITYVHWLPWRRDSAQKTSALAPTRLAASAGLAASDLVICNSKYGAERIRELVNQYSGPTVDIPLTHIPPGVSLIPKRHPRSGDAARPLTLVFPHRPLRYTGFRTLERTVLPSWSGLEERAGRRLTLVLTNPSGNPRINRLSERYPFVDVVDLAREKYLKLLSESDVVLGLHTGENQWSLSLVEALCAGCVPFVNSKSFYPELLRCLDLDSDDHLLQSLFYYKGTILDRLGSLLEQFEEVQGRLADRLGRVQLAYAWDTISARWVAEIQQLMSSRPVVDANSKSLARIRAILSEGPASKAQILRQLRWHPSSRHILWTRYRTRLLEDFDDPPLSSECVFAPIRQASSLASRSWVPEEL